MGYSIKSDILMVSMPFTLIRWPSQALGLLKSILINNNISCQIIYANLLYAEQVGLDAVLFAEEGWSQTFLCDWLFQRSLFPKHPLPAEEFVQTHLGGKRLNTKDQTRAAEILETLRQYSEAFLDNLVQEILKVKPRIVGCSLTVVQLFSSLALFKKLREQTSQVITLAGGPACEARVGLALHQNFPQIDYLFSGDAEDSICSVCSSLCEYGKRLDPNLAPYGLLTPAHRRQGYPVKPPRAKFDQLINNPIPEHSDFFDLLKESSSLKQRLHPALPFEGSRGCWWGERSLCNFCGDCGQYPKYRSKPGDRVFEEMNILNKLYGLDRFVATDNVISPDYFHSFFPKIKEEKNDWAIFYEIRTGLTKEEVWLMSQTGVTYVQAGIESLHTNSLKAMNKGVQSWQNIQCLKWCRQYGISITWFFLTRFPGEDDDWNQEQAKLLPFLAHLQPPRSVGIIRPDRHSPYFSRSKEEEMDIRVKQDYVRLFPGLENQANDFAFHLYDQKVINLLADPLDPFVNPGRFELQKATNFWWKEFWAKDQSCLEKQYQQNQAVVRDTRAQTNEELHILDKTGEKILEIADFAPIEDKFYRLCTQEGLKSDKVQDWIDNFLDKGIVLQRDGRIISLVLDSPGKDLPAQEDLPIGWIEGEEKIRASDPLNCDVFWQLISKSSNQHYCLQEFLDF